MSETVRQSTAVDVLVGPVLDADGVAVTGLAVGAFKISKNGAAPAALNASATATHRHTGHYSLGLTASDVDTVGRSKVTVDSTTNAMAPHVLQVIEEAVYDDFFAASAPGYLKPTTAGRTLTIESDGMAHADLKEWLGVAPLALASQYVQVDTIRAAGTAWNSGAILRATFDPDTGLQAIRSGTAQGGASDRITLDASASSSTDFYVGDRVLITGGAGVGQDGIITSYNGTTKLALVNANWPTSPDGTSTFAILPGISQAYIDAASQTAIASAVWASGTRTLTAGTNIQLPSNGLANISAWTVNITGNLSGSVGSVTGGINTGSGTITTLDALDTAQDTQHATTQAAVADVPTVAEFEARTLIAASYFDPAADTVANVTTVGSVTTKTGYELAASHDVYHARIHLTIDATNSRDEFTVTWFKNGARVTSGITSPTIQVIKRADGTDLVASTAMTQIASSGSYKYDEATNRTTAGEAVLVVVGATIDSGARSFADLVSRDSSA